MVTKNQLIRGLRKQKNHKNRVKALEGCPFKKGTCMKVYTVKPKKPNSAIRKVAKVRLSTDREIIVGIPGIGHKLQEHNTVLIRGGRCNDLPGVLYKMVRGKYDFRVEKSRGKKRSKYGVKKYV